MTILEVLRLSGRGASAQFRFGHRKPGSTTPLLFELTEKHLKDCERMYVFSEKKCTSHVFNLLSGYYTCDILNQYFFRIAHISQ